MILHSSAFNTYPTIQLKTLKGTTILPHGHVSFTTKFPQLIQK